MISQSNDDRRRITRRRIALLTLILAAIPLVVAPLASKQSPHAAWHGSMMGVIREPRASAQRYDYLIREAEASLKRNVPDEAIEYLDQTSRMEWYAGSTEVMCLRGDAWMQKGDLKAALAAYHGACAFGDTLNLLRYAKALSIGQRHTEALAAYDIAARQQDGSTNGLSFIEPELKAHRNDPAFLQSAIEVRIGIDYFFTGYEQKAIAHYQEAVRCAPSFAIAYLQLGQAQYVAGQADAARRSLTTAATLGHGAVRKDAERFLH